MNKVIRTFFFFSKRERIGVAILLTALVFCLLAPRVYSFFKTEEATDFEAFDQAIALLEQNTAFAEKKTNTSHYQNYKNAENNTNTLNGETTLFYFDPNTISKDSLLLLGLSPKTANTIVNYRNKNGKFYQPEGFKKMNGLSPEQYQQLLPYIHITAFGETKPVYAANKFQEEHTPIVVNRAPFDPNTASTEELQALGVPPKVAATFEKFRSKGGNFYKKEDVKKIFGLSESLYQQLEPFINIPKEVIASNNTPTSYDNSTERISTPTTNLKKPVSIDINKATPEDWQSLNGIGPSYAKRITGYRDKLGGFTSIQQVAETYGFPDSTFQKIKPSLITSPLIRKIPINTCDAKTLSDHPYISYQLANVIIAYRNQHGAYKDVEALKEVGTLSEEVLGKIGPYIAFD